jgi:hypothetical protein
MAQPTQPTTPLDWRTKIVNPDGTPNNYFIRLWQTVYGNSGNASQDIAALKAEVAALEAADLQAGTGIDITPDGKLLSNPTIALADTAVTPGTYGDASHVGQFTVDQKGRITAASNIAISGGGGGGYFSGATGSIDSTISGTSFATKGLVIKCLKNMAIERIMFAVDPSGLTETYNVGVASISSITFSGNLVTALTVGTVLGRGVNTNPSSADGLIMAISLTSPVTLTAGNYYLLYTSFTSGSGTSVHRIGLSTTWNVGNTYTLNAPVDVPRGAIQFNTTSITSGQVASSIGTSIYWIYAEGTL